ncbi:MAG: magnesium/cobalt transporter CorA, partial [Clostridia bacterium]|nr:magnesium/cobalt transporter CorA [Clostridia bacterium]
FEDYIYIVLKMLVSKEADDSVEMEQVSLILGVDYVLSFSESGDEIFKPVRDRIHNNKSSIRSKGPDYLTYALLDSVVDGYYAVLEKVGENIEVLEDKLLTDPSQKTLHDVHRVKGVMLNIRHAVWPLREVLTGLEQSDSAFVNHDTALHMRDVYFHAVQIIDTIEIYREMLSGMLDIYLSSVNNKMNEVMKVLTIFAAIFIPLTLISGIYGMNFKYMPELNWPFGYPLSIALMLVVTGFMLLYFKRKRWL